MKAKKATITDAQLLRHKALFESSEEMEQMLNEFIFPKETLNNILIELVQEKNSLNAEQTVDKIKKLVCSKDADPNVIIDKSAGATALMIACSKGKHRIVCTLLEINADPNMKDSKGQSAIFYAFDDRIEGINILASLLEKGVDIDIENNDGFSPLFVAITKGNYKCVRQLLQKNPKKKTLDKNRENILHYAVKSHENRLELCNAILEECPNDFFFLPGKCGKKPYEYSNDIDFANYLKGIEQKLLVLLSTEHKQY